MNIDIHYAQVDCPHCGVQPLTKAEYIGQMMRPDALWKCPQCGDVADFDDDHWEDKHLS